MALKVSPQINETEKLQETVTGLVIDTQHLKPMVTKDTPTVNTMNPSHFIALTCCIQLMYFILLFTLCQ
jgi:hypothetical protein